MKNLKKSLLAASSSKMKEIQRLIDKISDTDINILISGEAGTGKELIAKIIHDDSKRVGSFVSLDPNSLNYRKKPEAELIENLYKIFDEAKSGTLMIDDLAASSLKFQNILSLIIKSAKPLNVRIISCTARNIKELTKQKRFDQDLYNKLIIAHINLPPLRDRKDDIIGLASMFIKDLKSKYDIDKTINKDALECLARYDFPGNVRELEAVITHAYMISDGVDILPQHFPLRLFERRTTSINPTLPDDLYRLSKGLLDAGSLAENLDTYHEYLKIVEPPLIKAALDISSENISKAAKLMNINRNTLAKKMKAYDIE